LNSSQTRGVVARNVIGNAAFLGLGSVPL
jgi:hypothetical protein